MKNIKAKILIIFMTLLGWSGTVWSGAEGHGSNQVKTRFLWSREIAAKILASQQCEKHFSLFQCETMRKKIVRSELTWNEDKNIKLEVILHGIKQTVTCVTTQEIDSPITCDVNRGETMKVLETIVTMLHEAGQAVGLSDELITDQIVIQMISGDQDLLKLASMIQENLVGEPAAEFDPKVPYYKTWCQNSVATLKRAEKMAQNLAKSSEEKDVLIAGVQEVLRNTNPKHQRYVMATLDAAVSDLSIYDNSLKQVRLLRYYYQFSIEDFQMLEKLAESPLDSGAYVRQILSRSWQLALNASTRKEEILLLSRTLERASLLLDGRDLNRAPLYNCVLNNLNRSLDGFSNGTSDQGKLQVLREGLKNAVNSLSTATCR